MPEPTRADKTRDKTRRGGLPAPTDDKPSLETGNGSRCSGCAETIQPIERLYFVRIGSLVLLRFHDVCYEAWANFKR